MRRLSLILLLIAGSMLSGTLLAAPLDDDFVEAKKLECFRRHAALLDKPSLHTVWKCWEIHGHLMEQASNA